MATANVLNLTRPPVLPLLPKSAYIANACWPLPSDFFRVSDSMKE